MSNVVAPKGILLKMSQYMFNKGKKGQTVQVACKGRVNSCNEVCAMILELEIIIIVTTIMYNKPVWLGLDMICSLANFSRDFLYASALSL